MAISTQQYIFDITRFRANQCGLDVKICYKIRVSNITGDQYISLYHDREMRCQ